MVNRQMKASVFDAKSGIGRKVSNMRGGMLMPSVIIENSPAFKAEMTEHLLAKGHTKEQVEKEMALHETLEVECWTNSLYQVLVYRGADADEMIHMEEMKGKCTWLSIKLRSKAPMKGPLDWQAMQDIKNNLCGIDCDAIQIFPRREFLVNTANQYHLIVFPPDIWFPFGWKFSRVGEEAEMPGAKQNFTSTTETSSMKENEDA